MAKSYKLKGHYASINDEVMDSPAYQDLKPPAIAHRHGNGAVGRR